MFFSSSVMMTVNCSDFTRLVGKKTGGWLETYLVVAWTSNVFFCSKYMKNMWEFVSLFVLFHHTLLPPPTISPSGQICIGQEDTHKKNLNLLGYKMLDESGTEWVEGGAAKLTVLSSLFCDVCWWCETVWDWVSENTTCAVQDCHVPVLLSPRSRLDCLWKINDYKDSYEGLGGHPYHTECVSQLVDHFKAIKNFCEKSGNRPNNSKGHHATFLTYGGQMVAGKRAIGSNIIWKIFCFPLLFSIDRFF